MHDQIIFEILRDDLGGGAMILKIKEEQIQKLEREREEKKNMRNLQTCDIKPACSMKGYILIRSEYSG